MTRMRTMFGGAVMAFLAGCGGSVADGAAAPSGSPSGSSSSGSSGASGSSSGGGEASCAAAVTDVEVASDDLNGYPPYAVSGCALAYVSTSGALVLRDLATGREDTLAAANERARRPAASSDVIAWEATEGGRSVIRVRLRSSGETKTVAGAMVSAGEPRVSATTVVFTSWLTADDADVSLYDAITGEVRTVFGGAAEQRFADVSAEYVVASDFSEDPDGKYNGASDLADIVVLDRASQIVTRRRAEKKQAFPMLVKGGVLAYLEWSLVHPEPKLEGYAIRVGRVMDPPSADVTIADVVVQTAEPVRPSTANGMIEWIATKEGRTVMWRAPGDRSSPPTEVAGLDGLHLYAPASASTFTVVASVPADRSAAPVAAPLLRAVAR